MTEPRTHTTFAPPIPEARRWLETTRQDTGKPLLNLSQAAPIDPPPLALRQAIADASLTNPAAHLYGPVLGLPGLRDALAAQWSDRYNGAIAPEQVAITAGCNQAFCTALALLCGEGDEIILPTPWYFNHKMAADMAGVRVVPLPTGADLLPDPEAARHLLTPRTRAIALVSPNNPAGVEYPPELLNRFYTLARDHGIALVLDETYRDFHSSAHAPHALFAEADWADTLIHLYSFSKAFRLTGHRVGALLTSETRLAQAEKFLDTHTICPSQLGQIAALWGVRNLQDWLAGERTEILERRTAITQGMQSLAPLGWHLRGCGAYFAYVEHPFDCDAKTLARWLVETANILVLPGTMFAPLNDPAAARHLRIAFANIDRSGIADLIWRLHGLNPALAPGRDSA